MQQKVRLNGQHKLKRATCFATLLQNELNSYVASFTNHVQTFLATSQVQTINFGSLAIVTETISLSWLISVMRLFMLKICEGKREKYRLYFVFPLPRPITPVRLNLISFAAENKEIATGLENEPTWPTSNFCRSGGIVPRMWSLKENAHLTPCIHNEGQEIAMRNL